MIEVPAAVTISGTFASVAIGATARAPGVTPKPARKLTFSLTTSSWARRFEVSGTAASSLMMTSIFLPATVSPNCCWNSLIEPEISRPVDCCGPVIGRMKPILTVSAANAAPARLVAKVAAAVVSKCLRFIWSSSHMDWLVSGRCLRAGARRLPDIVGPQTKVRRHFIENLAPWERLQPPRDAAFCRWSSPFSASRSRMRLALRVDDLLELAEHPHAGQELGEAAVRLALFLDRGDELAVLELDAVHRHVDLGDVDLVVLAVAQVVVKGLVGAIVADVAEERAERPVIVERQRQGENGAGRHLGDDAHVHRDVELGMDRPLHGVAVGDGLAALVLKEIDRMGGVVPQEMVGPAARIAGRVDVPAAKEVGLHVHLLDLELALLDLLVDVLVARVEPPHMAAHGGDAGLLGDLHQVLGVLDAVGDRNLDQHVLARTHHLLALAEMHLGRRGEDHRVGALDAFRQLAGVVRNTVFLGDLGGSVLVAANERGHLDFGNALERVEMLLPERALSRYADFHFISPKSLSLRGAKR